MIQAPDQLLYNSKNFSLLTKEAILTRRPTVLSLPLQLWFPNTLTREYQRGKYHCTIDLLFYWFGISCMTTDNFCFYLQNRLIQTSQTGGQWYSDTSPFSIPCPYPF
jgi:hypothetical protein